MFFWHLKWERDCGAPLAQQISLLGLVVVIHLYVRWCTLPGGGRGSAGAVSLCKSSGRDCPVGWGCSWDAGGTGVAGMGSPWGAAPCLVAS